MIPICLAFRQELVCLSLENYMLILEIFTEYQMTLKISTLVE